MKAPDKIYISIIKVDGKNLLCTNWCETDISSHAHVNETIQYIRKDALLEWLKSQIKIPDVGFITGLTYVAYQDVIEHINEM